MTAQLLFWISAGLVGYAYVGYGILLHGLVWLKSKINRNRTTASLAALPEVTLVICAYNEASCIEQKILNSLALHYLPDKRKILVVTDGSTDETPLLVKQFSDVGLLHQEERRGKAAAMNRAMSYVDTEITVFTDANTFLHPEALMQMIKYYANPRVGGVAGEKRVLPDDDSTAGKGESLYWRYESWLKRLDASLYTVVGAAGEFFSIRTALYEPLPEDTLLDDFVLSLKVVEKGYRFAYASEAYSLETPSKSLREEQKRKIRICAGGFQAMGMLLPLMNIFRHGLASFQYISHRVLRWAVVPFLLPIIYLANISIIMAHPTLIYIGTGTMQTLFYALALTGYVLALQDKKVKGIYPIYYFVFMNLAVYIGLWRFITKKQAVKWEKAERKVMHADMQEYTLPN